MGAQSIVATVLDDVEDIDLCFRELFDYFSQPSAWQCYDDIDESLVVLKAQGVRLAIASICDDWLNTICNGFK